MKTPAWFDEGVTLGVILTIVVLLWLAVPYVVVRLVGSAL